MSSSRWELVEVGSIAEVAGGGTPKTSTPEYWDGPIGWLTPRDLSGNEARYVSGGARSISEAGLSESSARLLPKGTVLVSSRAPIGYVAIASTPLATNQGFKSLVLKEGHLPEFFFYVMKTKKAEMESVAGGSTFKEISGRVMKTIRVPVPPLEEQRAIAEVLGSLDERISVLTKIAWTTENIRQALFKELVLDNPQRQEWPHVPLRDLCDTQYGLTASATDEPVGPRFVRVTDINKTPWVNWEKTPFVEVPGGQLRKYKLSPGDILVARMADPGKVALIDSNVDAVFASYLVRITTRPAELAQFVYGYLSSPEYANYAAGAQYGTVQKNMNARVIVGCDLPMPPAEVINRYSAIAVTLRAQMSAVLEEARTLANTRDALLPRLVSGELRIENPNRILDLAT